MMLVKNLFKKFKKEHEVEETNEFIKLSNEWGNLLEDYKDQFQKDLEKIMEDAGAKH